MGRCSHLGDPCIPPTKPAMQCDDGGPSWFGQVLLRGPQGHLLCIYNFKIWLQGGHDQHPPPLWRKGQCVCLCAGKPRHLPCLMHFSFILPSHFTPASWSMVFYLLGLNGGLTPEEMQISVFYSEQAGDNICLTS